MRPSRIVTEGRRRICYVTRPEVSRQQTEMRVSVSVKSLVALGIQLGSIGGRYTAVSSFMICAIHHDGIIHGNGCLTQSSRHEFSELCAMGASA